MLYTAPFGAKRMKNYELTEAEKENAILNAIPQEPNVHELGGGYYYTCHWLTCNNTVHRYDQYCSLCGQKLLWRDDDYCR